MSLAALLALASGAATAGAAGDLAAAWGERASARGRWRGLALAGLARVGRGAASRAPLDLAARIERAGLALGAGDLMAVKAGGALLAFAATLPLASLAPGQLGPAGCACCAAAAFLVPDLWLRRRTASRARAMDSELAGVLDLLRVAVAAGLSPRRALAEVGRRHPGVLAAELRACAGAIALGAPGHVALARLQRRCPCHGVPALVAAFDRAARLGASPAASLAAQAAGARARSARGHAERAARAAPKIQLVVALGLVPSVLLLVAAALAPAFMGR